MLSACTGQFRTEAVAGRRVLRVRAARVLNLIQWAILLVARSVVGAWPTACAACRCGARGTRCCAPQQGSRAGVQASVAGPALERICAGRCRGVEGRHSRGGLKSASKERALGAAQGGRGSTRARGVPISRRLQHSQVAAALPALRRPLRPRSCPPRHAGRLSLASARYFGACRCCAPALAAAPPAQSCARRPSWSTACVAPGLPAAAVLSVRHHRVQQHHGGGAGGALAHPAPEPRADARTCGQTLVRRGRLFLARCATHAPTSWLCVVLAAALALACCPPPPALPTAAPTLLSLRLPWLRLCARCATRCLLGVLAGCTHAGPL